MRVELFRQTRTNRNKIVKAGGEPRPYLMVYLHGSTVLVRADDVIE
jgi:hypothetical protein